MKNYFILFDAAIMIASCGGDKPADANGNKALQDSVQAYLDVYNKKYQELNIVANETSWKSQTHIVEGDTMNAHENNLAQEAYAKYTGSKENIETAKKYLAQQDQLTELQVKQLKSILYKAANNPE